MVALNVQHNRMRDRLFKLLLDKGVDPNITDASYNRNAVQWACMFGRTEQVYIFYDSVSCLFCQIVILIAWRMTGLLINNVNLIILF